MPDSKITALTSIGASTDPANDPLVLVDVSDTSMAATGTTKKVTLNQLLGASGTATLASATITGDLTVDTSTLKVDSANNRVGIGTATPAHALDVTSSATTVIRSLASAGNQAYVSVAGNGGVVGTSSFDLIQDGSSNAFVYNRANTYLAFGTNNSERYRIASDGVATWSNVGGVAGTAMTLNSTGLGVGMSPSAILSVLKSSATQATGLILRNGNGADGSSISLDFETSAGTSGSESTLAGRISGRRVSTGTTGALDFFVTNAGTLGSAKMTIDSSGNVGVGVTPSAWGSGGNIELNGSTGNIAFRVVSTLACNWYYNSGDKFIGTGYAQQYQQYQGVHKWFTSTLSGSAGGSATMSQLMTLDASGNLLVGTTSSLRNTAHSFKATGASTSYWAAAFQQDGTTSGGRCISLDLPNTNSSSSLFVYATNSSGYAFGVLGNGSLENATGSYGTISDLRLKENISNARNYLADLLKLRVVKYSLKSEASAVATKIGFIAQEVEQVFPTLVETNTEDVKSIKTTVLIPMLLKAIQELTARVEALEA